MLDNGAERPDRPLISTIDGSDLDRTVDDLYLYAFRFNPNCFQNELPNASRHPLGTGVLGSIPRSGPHLAPTGMLGSIPGSMLD